MDFKENICFAYVSDNLQHFLKFDLFDLCDLHFRSRSKICDARKIALMYHKHPLNGFSIPLKLIEKIVFSLMLHEVPLLKSYPTSLNRNWHNSQITQIIELNNILSEDVEYHILKTSNLLIKRFDFYGHLKKVFHIFFEECISC